MTTLQLDGNGHGSGHGHGFFDGYGDGYGTGNGYGESRGEGYGTGYRHYAFGDSGDGGLLLRGPEPTHDILTTHDALEALTFL
jgi:hypothetical protein